MSVTAAPPTTSDSDTSLAFEVTTSRWGRATMLVGLVASLAGPAYLLFVEGFWPGVGPILTGFLAVAAIFGVYWVLEPVTYFPMLGSAGLYQAFLIGNISNKLLPSAVAAQARVKSVPGTRKAELAAVSAICGAAWMHVASLALLVGVAGSWLLRVLPEPVTVSFQFVLPAILGPVLVQIFFAQPHRRTAVVALAGALAVGLGAVRLLPSLLPYGLMVGVVTAVVLAVLFSRRSSEGRG
jgi:hypothetical protein